MVSRTRLTALVIAIALLGWFVWGIYVSVRQTRLNKQLTTAVDNFDVLTVRVLLAEGADPNTREGGGPPPSWQERLADLIGHRPALRRRLGRPVIVSAASGPSGSFGTPDTKHRDSDIVRMLVAHGADVNAKSDTPDEIGQLGDTALLNASYFNGESATVITQIERMLLEAGASVNASDDRGDTALMYASMGNTPFAQQLIDRGANVNARDKNGITPLMTAIVDASHECVRLLLAHGADVNARDRSGDTALTKALAAGGDTVILLVGHGADVNAQRQGGITPLMLSAPLAYQLDTVRLLIAHGADVNTQADDGSTALMLAAEYHALANLRLLVDDGADINARDKKGHTVLWHARHSVLTYLKSGQTGIPTVQKQILSFLTQHGATE